MNVYEAIAIGSAILAVGAGAWDARRLGRTQRYSGLGLVIGAGGPVVSLVLYLLVTQLAMKQTVAAVLIAAGAGLGYWAARRAAISSTDVAGEVRLVGASWLPLPAALCVAALQICTAIHSLAGLIFSLAGLEAAVGFGVAAALTLMYRRQTLAAARTSEPVEAPQGVAK